MKHTDPCGVRDGIRATDRVELLQQRCNVILGCVRRDAQSAGDQLVRRALRQQRKHLQLSGGQRDLGLSLTGSSEPGDNKRVRFIVFADQLQPLHLGQDGCDPISERGIGHIDRQP